MTVIRSPHSFRPLSRRRFLALTAAAATTAVLTVRPGLDTFPVAAADTPMTLAPDASDAFRAVAMVMAQALPKLGIPGAALGIVKDGKVETAFFGSRDVLSQQPVTADTLFQAGSITKTYTATALMRLVEQGQVDLDAPVRTYLPALKLMNEPAAAGVTTKNLLTHTGDWWGDSITDTGDGDDAISRFVAEKLPTFPQLAPLGSLFSYNNTGFVLIGQMLEMLTGQPYRAAVQSLVLDPLGLTGSLFASDAVIARPHALAHRADRTGTNLAGAFFLPRNLEPAGGLFTTLGDLLTYVQFHLGDGTANGVPVLQRATLDRMQTPTGVRLTTLADQEVALPWLTIPSSKGLILDHPGDTFGQHAELIFLPDQQFALAILTNANTGVALPGVVLVEAGRQYLGTNTGGAAMSTGATAGGGMTAASMSGLKAVQLPAEKQAEYVGEYRTPSRVFTVRQMGNALIFATGPGEVSDQVAIATTADQTMAEVSLDFLKEDIGIVANVLAIEFLRRPDGSVGYMRIAERLFPKMP